MAQMPGSRTSGARSSRCRITKPLLLVVDGPLFGLNIAPASLMSGPSRMATSTGVTIMERRFCMIQVRIKNFLIY